MKHKFIPLILASMAVGALAACGPKAPAVEPMPDKYDLMQHWEKDTATDEVYTVTEKEGSFEVSYNGAGGEGEWACVSRSFAYDTAKIARFSEYKKVVFKGKLDVTTGANNVMFKVQGDSANSREVVFGFSSSEKTYEMPLNFISDWAKVSKLVFFANRNMNTAGAGKMTFTEFYLSKDEVVDANSIDKNAPSVPQDYTYYNDGDKLDIMYRWGYNDQIATSENDGKFTFTWGGEDHPKDTWKYVSALFKSGNAQIKDAGFKRLVYEFKGTAGKEAYFKVEARLGAQTASLAAAEKKVTMTGEVQTIEIDATSVLANAEATHFMLVIIPDAELRNPTAGQIELSKAYIDKTEVTPEVDPNVQQYNIYAGGETMKVMTDWRGKEASITVAPSNDNTYRITWGSKGQWDCARALVKNDDTHDLKTDGVNYAKYTFTGTAGLEVILKVEAHDGNNDKGNKEQKVTMTGEEQVVEFEITNAINASGYNELWVLVMPEPGKDSNATGGAIVLKDVQLYKKEIQPDPGAQQYNVYDGSDSMTVMTDWRDNDDGVTMVPANESQYKITWKGKGSWDNVKALVKPGEDHPLRDSGIKRAKITIVGTAGRTIMLKTECHHTGNDAGYAAAQSVYVPMTGSEQTVEIDITASVNNGDYDEIWVLIFPDPYTYGDKDTEGQIILKNCVFDKVTATPDTHEVTTNKVYYNAANVDKFEQKAPCYTKVQLDEATHTQTINWEKRNTFEGIDYYVKLDDGDSWFGQSKYNHLHVVLTSDIDVQVLVKPYDTEISGASWITLKANEEKVVDFDIPEANVNFDKVIWFCVNPSNADYDWGDGGPVINGTLIVKDFMMTREGTNIHSGDHVDIKNYTRKGDEFTFSEDASGNMVVDFDKESIGWANVQFMYTGEDVNAYNHVDIVVTSTVATTLMIKMNDSEDDKHEISLVEGENTLSFDIGTAIIRGWAQMHMFVGINEGDAVKGKLTFTQFRVSVKAAA